MNIIRSISKGPREEAYAPTDPAVAPPPPSNNNNANPGLDPSDPNWSLAISNFPAKLHPILKEIDDEGNGLLELDELTEVFTMYADLKKASADGEIAINALPKAIHPQLRVFDADGNGRISPMELSRGAELYADSKNQVKKLTKAVLALFLVLVLTIGAIVGLVVVVVEGAKETKTSSSGITTVAGSSKPAASATITASKSLSNANKMTTTELNSLKSLTLKDTANSKTFAYTVTGWMKEPTQTTFYAARGDTVVVQSTGALVVKDKSGAVLLSKTAAEAAAQRKLLRQGGGGDRFSERDSVDFNPTVIMEQEDTYEDTTEDTSEDTVDCGDTPLVTTQTGTFSNCLDSDNLHYWPANYDAGDCHGWRGTDEAGHVHDNSAKNIQCTENGITYDQYAGNLDCSGQPVSKSFILNECHVGIPSNLYDKARDISCCTDPSGPECTALTGTPRVDSVGTTDETIWKNGVQCNA